MIFEILRVGDQASLVSDLKDIDVRQLLGIAAFIQSGHMGVSKNNGTPKWMVKIMENPIKMGDLGVLLFLETPI